MRILTSDYNKNASSNEHALKKEALICRRYTVITPKKLKIRYTITMSNKILIKVISKLRVLPTGAASKRYATSNNNISPPTDGITNIIFLF